MELGKITEASDLVIHMTNDFTVHDYLEDGVWETLKSLHPNRFIGNSCIDHFVLTAEMHEELVGIIEIRENNHISLFCVEKEYRRRGIGRKLLRKAVEICKENNSGLAEVTVNSLPGTVHIYERLGFHPEKPERIEHDIPYTPMFLDARMARRG